MGPETKGIDALKEASNQKIDKMGKGVIYNHTWFSPDDWGK